ncbi:MAG: hypothetical protein ACMVO5_08060 [Polymorphobacter sp.]|uniref:hypothetical protein n=1 Tax=Polymorphobacter sp. TaxID=1909290 RepID=UPI003A8548D1
MSRYQPGSCRDCRFAEWRWVEQQRGERRWINPFQPGYCRASGASAATIGDGLKLPLDPQAPLVRCRAFADAEARTCEMA